MFTSKYEDRVPNEAFNLWAEVYHRMLSTSCIIMISLIQCDTKKENQGIVQRFL